ncbi:sigma factor G inhibitor Gin [Paenibacillus xerothermodurans]|uniref:Inhibitor of sigma-G Gin n=1 Tax=Paenibacillus xerothermodurans TaxID=1977292 RepID=A0A2W1NWG5_PAEXE|nr:sigma factor G inhibitor Gin [Paenibacillus xerothermodurans]PZE19178.1 inhibitor of sigma-G Gin [Paenibacillus xerothermodurans]
MGDVLQRPLTHNCIICGQKKEHGIMIITEFICDECEHEMVQTDVKDAKYSFYIHQMKRIFYKKDA